MNFVNLLQSWKSKLVLLALAIFSLQGCKEECIEVDVPYTEEEEYLDLQSENRELRYSVTENLKGYREEGAILFNQLGKYHVHCTITNIDEKGGIFYINARVESQGDVLELSASQYIGAGDTKEIRASKEVNPHTFKANVSIPTWTVTAPTETFEKQVKKTRTITKYRKCNTCVEDCGSKYEKESNTDWWDYLGWAFWGIVGLTIVGWIIRGLGL